MIAPGSSFLTAANTRSAIAVSQWAFAPMAAADRSHRDFLPVTYFFLLLREASESAAVVGPRTNVSSCEAMY